MDVQFCNPCNPTSSTRRNPTSYPPSQSNLVIPNPIDVNLTLFRDTFEPFYIFLIFFAKKFGKPKMLIVSLHRNLKKERNNYEYAANTPHYEHVSVTSTMLAKCSPK